MKNDTKPKSLPTQAGSNGPNDKGGGTTHAPLRRPAPAPRRPL